MEMYPILNWEASENVENEKEKLDCSITSIESLGKMPVYVPCLCFCVATTGTGM